MPPLAKKTKAEPPPIFFPTPEDFRAWLETHHASATDLWVGFYRKSSGQPSITWPQSVDEALCVGWIDGLRKSIDAASYKIRFTPRRKTSFWSDVNIGRVAELTKQDRMKPAGLAAFARRTAARSGVYTYEQRQAAELDRASEEGFRANPKAWEFFQSCSPSYRRFVTFWVSDAKREATRQKRLEKLIAASAKRERL